MYSRKDYKLLGLVQKVQTEFANCEMVDGKVIVGDFRAADYEIFDFEGKLVEESSSHREMLYDSFKDIYFYKENGNVGYRDEYNINGKFIGKTVFEKIRNNKIIEKSFYVNENGELKLGSHIIRDEKIDIETPYEDDIDIDEIAYYDKNEKIIPRQHIVFTESDRRTKKTKSKFKNGYQIETIINKENGEFSHRIVKEYDLNGNCLKHSCYEPYNNLYLQDKYEYEFDNKGNWTKKTQYHWVIGWGEFKLSPLSITRRKIEYFDKN